MQQWEFMFVKLQPSTSPMWFAQEGMEGWELIQILSEPEGKYGIFKRPIS